MDRELGEHVLFASGPWSLRVLHDSGMRWEKMAGSWHCRVLGQAIVTRRYLHQIVLKATFTHPLAEST